MNFGFLWWCVVVKRWWITSVCCLRKRYSRVWILKCKCFMSFNDNRTLWNYVARDQVQTKHTNNKYTLFTVLKTIIVAPSIFERWYTLTFISFQLKNVSIHMFFTILIVIIWLWVYEKNFLAYKISAKSIRLENWELKYKKQAKWKLQK